MKGHQQQQHSSPLLLPPKRRCTTLAAAVPALVVCSILLPLVFLSASTAPDMNRRSVLRSSSPPSTHIEIDQQKLERPTLQHYVIFSRNILAVSTTINSTVLNSQDSGSIVFHLFTDAQNFYAMKHWFDRNSYLEATVHVTNIEDHQKIPKDADSLEMEQIWPSEEFRVTIRNYSEPPQRQMRTEYISVWPFAIPKDLSYLWNLDMDGKVIGAIQFCGVTLGQLRSYIAEHSFNSDACVWLSGLNVIELEKWRDLRVTSMYDQSLQKLTASARYWNCVCILTYATVFYSSLLVGLVPEEQHDASVIHGPRERLGLGVRPCRAGLDAGIEEVAVPHHLVLAVPQVALERLDADEAHEPARLGRVTSASAGGRAPRGR
ncbi:hypothetical protein HU200_030480 [Digitaria exilis]|uniref:Hexosyltransferase n=1 Tax=Digitaria exilis TaxID=1010633 RepID=A0A835ER09_9POAL|nr:hypothetical protein HU200_030480 [Digitaria exilis]